MLEIVKIERRGHRPPNLPEWRVLFCIGRYKKTRTCFAEDEMAAWADTLRWYRWLGETFGRSDDQKT